MKDDAQASTSVWMATADTPLETKLKEKLRTDVCIVGAGIAGITTAYLLLREGRSVVLLDDGRIGGGMTGRTTAHLTNAFDDRYVEVEKLHGEKGARLTAQSHTAAIDKIEELVNYENINCGFERLDGFLFCGQGDSVTVLDEELAAAHRAGITGLEKVSRAPLKSFDTGPALRFRNQGQFHPLQYLTGLTKAIVKLGGTIYTETHAVNIEGGSSARVETADGASVSCDYIVVATNTPVNDRVAIHTKQAPYVTYVIGVRIPANSVPRALYWDTLDPYHYVRLQSDPADPSYDFLIVGGEDHKTGQANDGQERYAQLERWARERFPFETVEYKWSGQVMEPVDYLAFIGKNPLDAPNVLIATGDSGQGMTHGTIAGILLTDLIQENKNPWEDLYDPARVTLRALPEFAKENINVAEQFADYVTAGDIDTVNELQPESGAIIRDGLTKVAVYKDAEGKVHRRSAICPHLGCVVAWNSSENTWDCPCHGSRYDALGRVYQGPSNDDLSPLNN